MGANAGLGAAVIAAAAVVVAALVTTIGAVIVKVLDRRRTAEDGLNDNSPEFALLALQDAISQRDRLLTERDELQALCDLQRDELDALHARLDSLGLT